MIDDSELLISDHYSVSLLLIKAWSPLGGCSPSAASHKDVSLSSDGEDINPDAPHPKLPPPLSRSALSSVPGGHVNPAVSLAMVVLGKLKIWKFPFYVIAQFLGAFAGAAAVFGLYYGKLSDCL